MTTIHHHATLEFNLGCETSRLVCSAPPRAMCRAAWSCDCDQWDEVGVDTEGRPFHRWDESSEPCFGVFRKNWCNVVEWYENDEEYVPLVGVVTVPIDPVFDFDHFRFNVHADNSPEGQS